MTDPRWVRWTLAALVSLTAAGCGDGGSKRATVVRFPDWPYQRYQTLATIPFKVPEGVDSSAGTLIADLLERSLLQNPDNTFRLYTRAELKSVLTEQDFSRLVGLVDQQTTIPAGRLKAVQAIVVGAFTQFDLAAEKTPRKRVVPVYEKQGDQLVQVGQRVVVDEYYYHAAHVTARMQILDTATGEIVFSYEAEPRDEVSRRVNRVPRYTPQQLAEECIREIAEEFFHAVAVIRVRVKLKSDMLVVAREYYDGTWHKPKSKRLRSDEGRVFGVVRNLPLECSDNRFRMAVMKKEGREVLAEREFVWSGSAGERGESLPLEIGELYRRGGAGWYELKLYSGESPVLIRSFEIRGPED